MIVFLKHSKINQDCTCGRDGRGENAETWGEGSAESILCPHHGSSYMAMPNTTYRSLHSKNFTVFEVYLKIMGKKFPF